MPKPHKKLSQPTTNERVAAANLILNFVGDLPDVAYATIAVLWKVDAAQLKREINGARVVLAASQGNREAMELLTQIKVNAQNEVRQ